MKTMPPPQDSHLPSTSVLPCCSRYIGFGGGKIHTILTDGMDENQKILSKITIFSAF